MKTHLCTFLLFLSVGLSAQKTENNIAVKASDPTQMYTFLEGYVGLNFLGSNLFSASLDT